MPMIRRKEKLCNYKQEEKREINDREREFF